MPKRLSDAFGQHSIAIQAEQLSFSEALEQAVDLLVQDQRVTQDYKGQVMANLEELGPYFVVAPGIALAHARPSEAVLETGFSLLKLDRGVESGSANDPVRLLFAFCAVDADSHIELLGEFAEMISAPGKVKSLLNSSAIGVIRALLVDQPVR